MMNRREAIKRTTILLGGIASATTVLGLLNGCQSPPPALGWAPKALNEPQARAMAEMVDRILPKTDTPGAKEIGVHRHIDELLATIHTASNRTHFLMGLEAVMKKADDDHGKPFEDLTAKQQDELLRNEEQAALAILADFKTPSHGFFTPSGDHPKTPFFKELKELTFLCYFSSEEGCTEVLKYDPVPGAYQGCIPFEEVGKIWAT